MGFKKWRSHFRVPPGLRIKTRLNAMPLIWNDIYRVFFILMQIKLIFTRKVVHLVFGTRKRPISHWKIPTGKPGLEICHWNDPKSHVPSINVARLLACVAGVRKGRGRELGRETAREGGGRRFLSFLPRASQALSRTQIPASPFNACHAGYTLASIHNFNNLSSKDIFPSWGS